MQNFLGQLFFTHEWLIPVVMLLLVVSFIYAVVYYLKTPRIDASRLSENFFTYIPLVTLMWAIIGLISLIVFSFLSFSSESCDLLDTGRGCSDAQSFAGGFGIFTMIASFFVLPTMFLLQTLFMLYMRLRRHTMRSMFFKVYFSIIACVALMLIFILMVN